MFLDIDRFKELNDRIGHERANRLLAELAVRLHSCVRAIDTVARYGGDEFAIILTNLNDAPEANAVIKRVRAATVEPFSVLGKHVDLSVSIGVAMFPSDAGDGESLVMAADRDMYRCKRLARRARRAPATEPAALGQRRAVANSPHDRAWA
jgi:diguanylate cyclase (GGDEF)-like protein